jgi:hypothetical protein
LGKLAAKNPEAGVLNDTRAALVHLRKSDKALREKLLVLLMAKEEGWESATKLERRLEGLYQNEHVAKIMEEKEKQRAKEKREKEKSKAGPTRGKRYYQYGGDRGYQTPVYSSPGPIYYQQTFSPGSQRSHPYRRGGGQRGFDRGGGENKPLGCYRCGSLSHQVKYCPEKPKF